jgi:NTE family protein
VALVLAGGAARGAYEVGVVMHLLEEVARDVGHDLPLDILCGTSVGAINVCLLAAFADEPRARGARLYEHWTQLRMRDLLHADSGSLFNLARSLFGRAAVNDTDTRRGGMLDPKGIEDLVRRAVPFPRIGEHLRAGLLHAVTISTTHVGSGRTVVFVQRGESAAPLSSSDPTVVSRGVTLGPDHALASAAIPFLFPAVRIEGEFYCDGGLRQNVPLSPARRLGADGLIVVSPRYLRPQTSPEAGSSDQVFPGPLFLLGKALNALLLDRVENDIDRLERINKLLEAGCRHYGPGFLDAINAELGHPPTALRTRPLKTVLIRATADIGRMASEFVRSSRFPTRVPGVLGRVMRRVAESNVEADLLSYLLFDGEFAADLIALGRSDARSHHTALCTFFSELGTAPSAAVA